MNKTLYTEPPGGPTLLRPLHVFFLIDCSSTMGKYGKIQALNNALRDAVAFIQKQACKDLCEVFLSVIKYSDGAKWHIKRANLVEEFKWVDLSAGGCTDMGQAFTLLADQLKMPPMEPRSYRPTIILIAAVEPSDDWRSGLEKVLELPWGQKALRLAIAIGDDFEHGPLVEFINNPEIPVLQANNSEELADKIRRCFSKYHFFLH